MKKRNLLFLVLFSFISIFLGIKVVNADDVTMYIECSYNLSYGSVDGSGPLYVMYTDLLDYDGNRYEIKAKKTATGTIENIGDITGYFGFDVNHSSDGHTTFSTAMASNNGKCPTYMTVEYKDRTWGDNNFKVLFYNSLNQSSNCSGTPGTSCKAYFKLGSTVNNVKVNPAEDKWSHYYSTESTDICSDLTTVITVKDKQLYALPTYGRNTKYIQGINWTSAQKIKYFWFTDIANLALDNTLDSAYFDPDTDNWRGTTEFSMNLPGRNESSCIFTNASFTKAKTCVTATDSKLVSVFAGYEQDINSIYPDIEATYNSLTYQIHNPQVGGVERHPYTYASYKDKTKLQEVMDKVAGLPKANTTKAENVEASLKSIQNGTHSALGGNTPCQETIEKATNLLNRLSSLGTTYTNKLNLINQAAENARAKAEDLGATTEELQAMDATLSTLQSEIDANETFIRRLGVSLLDGADLHLSGISNTGCGVISADLRAFLNTVLWYIRIAGVVLAIILSLLDYIKAATGADDKSMEAANKRFMTRVILVAVLFLVPVLLDFLLSTLNISTTAGSISCLD